MTDGTLITLVSLGVCILFVIGVPIFLVLGLWIVGCSMIIDFTLANLGVTLFEGLNFFGLLALPLFILTGDLINASGIARRLVEFAYSALGWLRGGLAMTTLGACGLFAAISGSNSATTAAIGSIMYPEMNKAGYDSRFSAATAAAGGTVGIIIPPSIIFIVYGFLLNLSISDLFIAGVFPGMLMVLAMMLAAWFVSKRNNWGHIIKFDARKTAKAASRAYLGFFAIFIVIFGIYSGAFSPTEAAGVTVAFCLLAGLAITREITFKSLPEVIMRSGRLTGMLAPLIAVSIVMQQILSLLGAKEFFSELINSVGGGYYAVIIVSMLIMLVAGCILESLPDTVIFAPILAPAAAAAGVDPYHFAVIFLVGDAIGFITPPYGLNLYVASGVTGIPYLQIVRRVMPYFVALLIAWIVIALWPGLSIGLIRH
jgi:C4-dicarboxylate transporter DctM subunit